MPDQGLPRRTFITSLGAASAVAGAVPVPQGGGKRFRVGFIGLGRRGRSNLVAALKQPDIETTAFSDVYKPNLELALKLAPGAKVYVDFRDLLADRSVDAVCIATPDHWHAYMTIEACKAGKDVYVEKPISVTVHEGQLMVKAARKYERIVQVGTQQRSGDHYKRAVEIVRSGRLGDISSVRTWDYVNSFPEGIGNPPDERPPADLDWNMWLGPAPDRPFNRNRFGVNDKNFSYFRWFWDYAGGMMTDLGIHSLDIVLWAMGIKGPNVATTVGGNFVMKDNRETPDTLQAMYEFSDFICDYEYRDASGPARGKSLSEAEYGITFHGTEGTLFVDRAGWELIPQKRYVGSGSGFFRRSAETTDRIPAAAGVARINQTASHWADFVQSMKTRKPPIADIEEGHRSTVIALLGNVAMRSRQRIEWDPEAETTDNKEAQTYLRREYRPPWKLEL